MRAFPHADQDIYVAVDICLFYQLDQRVLLIKRKFPPYKDKYVLPGGFVETNELVMEAALRELKEEVGITSKDLVNGTLYFNQVSDAIKRDPRGRVMSISFYGEIKEDSINNIVADDDALSAHLVDTDEIYEDPTIIGFDHWDIITRCMAEI